MAGRKPKPEGQARNRAKPAHDWTEVVDAPYVGDRPSLPTERRVILQFGDFKDIELHDLTHAWWETVSTMPHCTLWTEADWRYAISTALVADAFHYGHTPSATELARREKVLGTTVDARRDLRIRYVEAKTAPTSANVTSMDDYRDL